MKHLFSIVKTIVALFLVTLSLNTFADAISDAIKVQDYETAFRLTLKEAESGKVTAQHNACVSYLDGMGTEKNIEKAFYWCNKAALKHYTDSESTLGDIYYNKEDYKNAIKWYGIAAKKGDFKAQVNLGDIYEKGLGVPKDGAKAVALFLKAAAQNTDDQGFAFSHLSSIYLRGEVVQKDKVKAIEYAEKGAPKGSANCQYYLGFVYLYGQGGKTADKEMARKWLTNAANAGHPDAIELLKSL